MEYEAVIGLEVHVQLNTKSKIFCRCSTAYAYQEANTFVCPVCMGLPGVLPVLNEEVLEKAIRTVLATGGTVSDYSKFDRKNYFYPDLPKAYQISQYDRPIGLGGTIAIETEAGARSIRIKRCHMEEDAGKLIHEGKGVSSLVDYNRSGVPLLEIVSEADLRTAKEAWAYLLKLKAILEYLEVSTCNMEEGTLRCDANVSIRPVGQEAFGTRAEIKNLNSFRWVARAIDHEIERQRAVLDEGQQVVQETRLWDADRAETRSMRSKEEAHDYRYFPDPDLPPVIVDPEQVERLRSSLPELPDAKQARFVGEYGIPAYDAGVLTADAALAGWYETAVRTHRNPKSLSNWIMTELLGRMNEKNILIQDVKIRPEQLAELVKLIDEGVISGKIAKDVFVEMFENGTDPAKVVKDKGLVQISDTSVIEALIQKVMAAHPNVVDAFLGGKVTSRGFLVGAVMKETKGQANPGVVNRLLDEALAKKAGEKS